MKLLHHSTGLSTPNSTMNCFFCSYCNSLWKALTVHMPHAIVGSDVVSFKLLSVI